MTTQNPSPSNPDVEDEAPAAKSAEDRKAASALANLDSSAGDDASSSNVDQEAVNKAMKSLGDSGSAAAAAGAAKKNVKVDPADVALIVEQLELSKPKATELLKFHDGDAVSAMRAYVKA